MNRDHRLSLPGVGQVTAFMGEGFLLDWERPDGEVGGQSNDKGFIC